MTTITSDNVYLNTLNVKKLWANNILGNNIKVAFLEGAVCNIPNKLIIKGWFNTYTNSYTEYFTNNLITSSHGFNTASVICGKDIGIAPNVELYNVIIETSITKIDDVLSTVKKGIKWCISNDIDIINLSVEIPKVDSELLSLANYAALKNITIVCAFGNSKIKNNNPFTCSSATLSIGAVNIDKSISSFSNYGDGLDFVCFGDSVPCYNSTGELDFYSGTSCSTALATGLIALIKQQNKFLSNKEIRYLLMDNCEDLGEPGKDDIFGYGLISAFLIPCNYKTNEDIYNIEKNININSMPISLNTSLLPGTIENPIVQISPKLINSNDVLITTSDESLVKINHYTNSITALNVGKPTITFSIPKKNFSKSLTLRILSEFESEIEEALLKYNIPYVQSNGFLGNNVKVAIIDSGINKVGNIDKVIYGPNYIYGNSTTSTIDDYSQGTITASIVKSITPNCTLYSIKNQSEGGYSYLSEDLQNKSLQWCLDNKIDIIIARNLLLGVYTSKNEMFKKLNKAGIITIVKQGTGDSMKFSASNTEDNLCVALLNNDNTPFVSGNINNLDVTCYYAGFPAYTKDGKLEITSTQNFGASLGIVGGICALLKQQDPSLNVISLRSLLPTLCTNIGSINNFGYGILKASLL